MQDLIARHVLNLSLNSPHPPPSQHTSKSPHISHVEVKRKHEGFGSGFVEYHDPWVYKDRETPTELCGWPIFITIRLEYLIPFKVPNSPLPSQVYSRRKKKKIPTHCRKWPSHCQTLAKTRKQQKLLKKLYLFFSQSRKRRNWWKPLPYKCGG